MAWEGLGTTRFEMLPDPLKLYFWNCSRAVIQPICLPPYDQDTTQAFQDVECYTASEDNSFHYLNLKKPALATVCHPNAKSFITSAISDGRCSTALFSDIKKVSKLALFYPNAFSFVNSFSFECIVYRRSCWPVRIFKLRAKWLQGRYRLSHY